MKRTIHSIFAMMAILLLGAAVTACSGSDGKDSKTTKPVAKAVAKGGEASSLPNYRYVDIDTILSRYNLAKDYNEQMLRLQSSLKNKEKQHETTIGNFAQSMENKYRNNGYLSEASFNQDKEKLAGMQQNAQRDMSQATDNAMRQQAAAEKVVMDSIQAFINVYMSTHSYDAIFFKNATLYINPALDITDEVVEGLNARYNKKKK